MPMHFTLMYRDRTNDTTDTLGDVGLVGVTGPLLFETTFTPGARLRSADGTECPRSFPAVLDTDGRLKPIRGGDDGIRLWANDPAYGITRFQYRVIAPNGLTDLNGEAVPWLPFYFDAPGEDIIRYLHDEIPKPGQKFGRGRPGFGIRDVAVSNGLMTVTTEGGIELDPVEIPGSHRLAAAYAMTFGRL